MKKSKADPGDTVTWKYPLGAVIVTGKNTVMQVLKATVDKPTRYKLDNGNTVKAWEIIEVTKK